MPNSTQGWIVWAAAQIVLTYLWKILVKLAENAVLGWGEEQIASWLGITSPTLSTVITWLVPFILAGLTLAAYHWTQLRWFAAPTVAIHTIGAPHGAIRDNIISQIPRHLYAHAIRAEKTLGPKVTVAWVLIIACGVGLIVGISLLATNRSADKPDTAFFNLSRPATPQKPQASLPAPKQYTAYEKGSAYEPWMRFTAHLQQSYHPHMSNIEIYSMPSKVPLQMEARNRG
jgi:hypothetical protein